MVGSGASIHDDSEFGLASPGIHRTSSRTALKVSSCFLERESQLAEGNRRRHTAVPTGELPCDLPQKALKLSSNWPEKDTTLSHDAKPDANPRTPFSSIGVPKSDPKGISVELSVGA